MSEEARLDQVLTPEEMEDLTTLLKELLCDRGWGKLFIKVKGGRIDKISTKRSVLVRKKKSD